MKPLINKLDAKRTSNCAECGMPFDYDGLGISGQMRYFLGDRLVALYSPKGTGQMRCTECGLKNTS